MARSLHDESGKRLGWYLSEEEYMKLMYAYAKAEFARQEAEEKPRAATLVWKGNPCTSIDQILAMFHQLENDHLSKG
ncbi:MAG: hypothetical protein ACSLE1_13100 [Sphingobium sp.]